MQASYWGELALQPCDHLFRPPIIHPLGKTFFLSPVFHCRKNSRWRLNLLRCERSLEKISPALQANFNSVKSDYKTTNSQSTIECTKPVFSKKDFGNATYILANHSHPFNGVCSDGHIAVSPETPSIVH